YGTTAAPSGTIRRTSRLGRGTAFRCRRHCRRAPRPAQPLRIGPGFIRARYRPSGRGRDEPERGGGVEFAAEQIGRAGRLKSQGPPVLAARADLGEFHLAPRLAAQPWGACRDLSAGRSEEHTSELQSLTNL